MGLQKTLFLERSVIVLTELCRDFPDMCGNCSRFVYVGYTLLCMKVKLRFVETLSEVGSTWPLNCVLWIL